jgi:hypothetical protein
MVNDINNENREAGAARTVEVYHIEEAVRRAREARARYTIRMPFLPQKGIEDIRPVESLEIERQNLAE